MTGKKEPAAVTPLLSPSLHPIPSPSPQHLSIHPCLLNSCKIGIFPTATKPFVCTEEMSAGVKITKFCGHILWPPPIWRQTCYACWKCIFLYHCYDSTHDRNIESHAKTYIRSCPLAEIWVRTMNVSFSKYFGFLWDNREWNIEVKWVKQHATPLKHDLLHKKKHIRRFLFHFERMM